MVVIQNNNKNLKILCFYFVNQVLDKIFIELVQGVVRGGYLDCNINIF